MFDHEVISLNRNENIFTFDGWNILRFQGFENFFFQKD